MSHDAFLSDNEFINWRHPSVYQMATEIAERATDRTQLIQRCYEFVRDQIRHSVDAQDTVITIKASDVLIEGSGYCYAKSHLLAALLRANSIPAALCYQRLSLEGGGAPFCLHGLNAVQLEDGIWYRIDPRGNKPGVNAAFCPPQEQLAFPLNCAGEQDIEGRFSEPLPAVIAAMQSQQSVQGLYHALPDLA